MAFITLQIADTRCRHEVYMRALSTTATRLCVASPLTASLHRHSLRTIPSRIMASKTQATDRQYDERWTEIWQSGLSAGEVSQRNLI